MIKRIVDISRHSFLYTRLNQLHIEQNGELISKIPVEDIGVLLLSHPNTSITQAIINKCLEFNVAVVFCNQKHIPTGLLLPLSDGHSLHSKIVNKQANANKIIKKRLWQRIVIEKIKNQSKTLSKLNLPETKVLALAKKVQSNDKLNHEAQAAKLYWKIMFNGEFRRDPDLDDLNSLFNYGYAVIRAVVARAIACSGLHPALGIFHKNQYNAYCLADDLMEPFRPWIDYLVYSYYLDYNSFEINQEFKKYILQCLESKVSFDNKKSPLFVAISLYVSSFKDALFDSNSSLIFPQVKEMSCLLED